MPGNQVLQVLRMRMRNRSRAHRLRRRAPRRLCYAALCDGPTKRTPSSAFDPAVGKDIYEPERIVAKRTVKGGNTQWQVKWKGYDAKDNTWEPIDNLAGCEDMIAEDMIADQHGLADGNFIR